MFISDSVGFFSQSIQYDEPEGISGHADLGRRRPDGSVPFPDSRAIEYPERAAWQALSERRLARYGDSDYLFDRDDKTKSILKPSSASRSR